MPEVQIVIDVAGESAGSPGTARSFPYSKVASSAVLVTLSLSNTAGVDSFFWELIDQPPTSTAVLNDSSIASPIFEMTEGSSGTYLVRCTINSGQSSATNAVAITTANLSLRKIAASESLEFNPLRGWMPAWNGVVDAIDAGSISVGGLPVVGLADGMVEDIAVASGGTAVGSFDISCNQGLVTELLAYVQTGSTDDVDVELGDSSFSGSPDILYQIGQDDELAGLWDPDTNGNWKDRNAWGFKGLTAGLLYYRFTNNGANAITMGLAVDVIGKA